MAGNTTAPASASTCRRAGYRFLSAPPSDIETLRIHYEWDAGDVINIPPNTIHQSPNADPERPVRLISALNRSKNCRLSG
jgi:hypothetical protein